MKIVDWRTPISPRTLMQLVKALDELNGVSAYFGNSEDPGGIGIECRQKFSFPVSAFTCNGYAQYTWVAPLDQDNRPDISKCVWGISNEGILSAYRYAADVREWLGQLDVSDIVGGDFLYPEEIPNVMNGGSYILNESSKAPACYQGTNWPTDLVPNGWIYTPDNKRSWENNNCSPSPITLDNWDNKGTCPQDDPNGVPFAAAPWLYHAMDKPFWSGISVMDAFRIYPLDPPSNSNYQFTAGNSSYLPGIWPVNMIGTQASCTLRFSPIVNGIPLPIASLPDGTTILEAYMEFVVDGSVSFAREVTYTYDPTAEPYIAATVNDSNISFSIALCTAKKVPHKEWTNFLSKNITVELMATPSFTSKIGVSQRLVVNVKEAVQWMVDNAAKTDADWIFMMPSVGQPLGGAVPLKSFITSYARKYNSIGQNLLYDWDASSNQWIITSTTALEVGLQLSQPTLFVKYQLPNGFVQEMNFEHMPPALESLYPSQ